MRVRKSAELVSAKEACARLGVKPATLYTYVSRGRIRTVSTGARGRLYVAADVDRLSAHADARRGHAAAAGGALQFGAAVLDSAITSVDDGRIRYRGHALSELVRARTRFEQVVELLVGLGPGPWPVGQPAAVPAGLAPIARLVHALPAIGARGTDEPLALRARRLLVDLVASSVGAPTRGSIAETLARALGREDAAALLDAVLVTCADHELNVSTFSARIAASAGADLAACVGSALYVFTGPRHGTASDRVAALLEACRRHGVEAEVERRLAAGDELAGFGHPLYPNGDPRAPLLLDLAEPACADPAAAASVSVLRALCAHARDRGVHPTLDHGLLAVALALGAPPGTAAAWFALGRTAGWIAHAEEQRGSPRLLRPRARYVGP